MSGLERIDRDVEISQIKGQNVHGLCGHTKLMIGNKNIF